MRFRKKKKGNSFNHSNYINQNVFWERLLLLLVENERSVQLKKFLSKFRKLLPSFVITNVSMYVYT